MHCSALVSLFCVQPHVERHIYVVVCKKEKKLLVTILIISIPTKYGCTPILQEFFISAHFSYFLPENVCNFVIILNFSAIGGTFMMIFQNLN